MLRNKQAPLSADEIKKMRKACKLAARHLEHIEKYVQPGVTTAELDQILHDFTLSHGAVPGPLGYHGFPKSVCTSVNHVICHGVPDETVLREGDLVNIDVTPVLEGFYGDTSATFCVGQVSEADRDLVEVARLARDKGIEIVRAGLMTGDIGFITDKFVTRRGYTTVKEIGGHGIGRIFHDEPFVPAYGKRGRGELLRAGYCITVEPMVNAGSASIREFGIPNSEIKWYETVDGKKSAQFEHTILVTEDGYEILTLPD